MAAPGSWTSIRDYGLLSTSALLDRYAVDAKTRIAIESQRRPNSVIISQAGIPDVVVRDQLPMSDGALNKCLDDGLTPTDWYRILNARTFFWLSRVRLHALLEARAYRDKPQTILTLRTRSLVEAHESRIELSPINSGSTIFKPVRRGNKTFLPISEYDFESWRAKRNLEQAVVELVVRDGVADVRDHVVAVHDAIGGSFTELWRRPGTDASVGP